ncbi:phasin family protein [Aliihoeflea sp. PC F10.4]
MTKTKTEQTAASFFNGFTRAFDDFGATVQVPEAARDFVRNQAVAASKRAEDAHKQIATFADQAKNAFGPFAGSYATVTNSMLEGTLANTRHYFATVEKLADANSFGDAVTIQSDYMREATTANIERIRSAADQAKSLMEQNAKIVQDQVKTAA